MGEVRLYRDSSSRFCCELDHIPAEDYPRVCKEVCNAFGMQADTSSFVAGLDLMAMNFTRDQLAVEMAWDNWSGFFVTAKDSLSESLVRKIADWLRQSEGK